MPCTLFDESGQDLLSVSAARQIAMHVVAGGLDTGPIRKTQGKVGAPGTKWKLARGRSRLARC